MARRLIGLIGLAAGLIAPSAGATEPTPPHIVDVRGDANSIAFPYTPGGFVGQIQRVLFPQDPLGGGIATEPASHANADILSARLTTTYEAVPVGEDGVDYRATGMRVDVRTAARPAAPQTDVEFTVASFQNTVGCATYVNLRLRGSITTGTGPAEQVSVRFGDGADGCPIRPATVTDPRIVHAIDPGGFAIDIPFVTVGGDEGPLFEGVELWGPEAWSSTSLVRFDATLRGRDFTVGEDMPADVPCTRACP